MLQKDNSTRLKSQGRFAWYELMTTDVEAAQAFYGEVLGWGAQDASTPELPYMLFFAGAAKLGGLMPLPEDAKKMGATPRWMGYVGVDDVDATVARITRLGGAIYVAPTNSNIGRIAVVADPQKAIVALIEGRQSSQPQPIELDALGRVGWHELLAADWATAFTFYSELFGWQKADTELGPTDTYQLFSSGEETIGGIFTKRAAEPIPYWLYYFNVEDVDAAAARVKNCGGRILEGPIEVPEGSWMIRCIDPQSAIFALQGKRRQHEIGWSTSWSGISSRGRLIDKPRGR